MATRRESVVLTLDDRFSPGIIKAATATALFERELKKADGTTVKANRSLSSAEGTVLKFDKTTRSATPTIDKLSGRIELFARSFAAIGPAAVPITGVAIPAVIGLTTELGFAAAGATTLMLAFHGVGDALTALNKAALSPTVANIAAADLAFEKIGPSAGEFVVHLHEMVPLVMRLQQAAGAGLFPGLTDSIDLLATKAPDAERILHAIGSELGALSREGAQSLTGKDWAPFFHMIEHDAPRALGQMAHATGDVAHGLAQILLAFQPLNRDMVSGLERMAASFDHWASGLSQTDGFQGFVEYMRTNGPLVLDTLGDIADTFVHLIEAAAPLGGPTLQALDDIAQILDSIASSPLATPLIGLIQILSVAKFAMIGFGKVADASFGPKSQMTLRTYTAGIRENAKTWLDFGAMTRTEMEAQRQAGQRLFGSLGRGVGVLAAVGVATTGVTEKMGATNTAMDAMAGAMVGGVPGAIAGGLIGAVQDYHAATSQASQITDTLSHSMKSATGNIKAQAQALEDAQAARDAVLRNHQSLSYDLTHPFESIGGVASSLDGTTPDEATNQAIAQQRVRFDQLQTILGQLGTGLGANFKDSFGRDVIPTLSQLQQVTDRATPALEHFGLTWDDLNKLAQDSPGAYQRAITGIERWTKAQDSNAGRTQAVSRALAGLSGDMESTADKANDLADALDGLFSPKMNLNAARNAWVEALHALKDGLSDSGREILGQSDAALHNQDAIRGLTGQLLDYLKNQAAAGKSAKEIIATYHEQRQALIDTAGQLGINKRALGDYLKQLGFTPKAIHTLIQLDGTNAAERKLNWLTRDRIAQIKLNVSNDEGVNVTGGHIAIAPGAADGMTVPGPRHPYRDSVLALLAPTEEVVPNRHGEADHLRATGRLPGFADGGSVMDGHRRRYKQSQSQRRQYASAGGWQGMSDGAPTIDYDRLTRAMLAARPLYGDVSVNGDPTVWRRQMQQDAALAGLSGARRA